MEKIHRRSGTPVPFSQWDISAEKKKVIIQEMYNRSVSQSNSSNIERGYYYTPQVTDIKKNGLYHVDNFSHRMPINVINSSNLVTIVREGITQQASKDSIKSAINKHADYLDSKLKQAIKNKLQSVMN